MYKRQAQEQGLAARGLRMTVEEVEKAPLPLIAHWRFHAFVVAVSYTHLDVYKRQDFGPGIHPRERSVF